MVKRAVDHCVHFCPGHVDLYDTVQHRHFDAVIAECQGPAQIVAVAPARAEADPEFFEN